MPPTNAATPRTRKLPDNSAAVDEIMAELRECINARTIGEVFGELVVKINFTAGKIVSKRITDEKIRRYDD